MSVHVDPEGNEISALSDLADLEGREVLEIGSGDGRLTWRYADEAAGVTAVEPFGGAFERARWKMPRHLRESVELRHESFEEFAAHQESSSFDVAILSWSLC
jgi:16S rRNA A1518/A1519 N6-dimethyltransferase RsmA/KsgA/DIM1 with predicted DNA glycosylase/AP lyase activity